MRRSRRGRGSHLEFGGSGEDSFVAVVVTKLTGALLFILLLAMVIMALLPKAVDSDARHPAGCRRGASLPDSAGGDGRARPTALGRRWRPSGMAQAGRIHRPDRRHTAERDRTTAELPDPCRRWE